MPTDTLELPREMVRAARFYAERENRTVTEMFADLMGRRYGFKMAFTVVRPSPAMTKKRIVPVPDSIKSISGVVSLPAKMSEEDIAYEAAMAN